MNKYILLLLVSILGLSMVSCKDDKVRLIIVEDSIYTFVKENVEILKADWKNEGVDIVKIIPFTGQKPEELRALLKSEASDVDVLEGAVLIGDLPIPAFQQYKSSRYFPEEEPIDYYYMDFDIQWQDNLKNVLDANGFPDTLVAGSDGIFDGDIETFKSAPEIIIGRINPLSKFGDKATLINQYLQKIHRYRTGAVTDILPKALVYLAKYPDFISASHDTNHVKIMFPSADVVTPETTPSVSADVFYQKLAHGYTFMTVWAHGVPTQFTVGSDAGDAISGAYITGGNKVRTNFFLLQSCSVGNFSQWSTSAKKIVWSDDFLAGRFIFENPDYGMVVLSHTRPSAVFAKPDYFYDLIGSGESIGSAQVKRLKAVILDKQFSYIDLFESIQGDPFLKPKTISPGGSDLEVSSLSFTTPSTQSEVDNSVYVTLKNWGKPVTGAFTVTLSKIQANGSRQILHDWTVNGIGSNQQISLENFAVTPYDTIVSFEIEVDSKKIITETSEDNNIRVVSYKKTNP